MKPTKRILLKSVALSSFVIAGCKPGVVYANPKGSHYDSQLADAAIVDASVPTASDAGAVADVITPLPIPGNPKGSLYDRGGKR